MLFLIIANNSSCVKLELNGGGSNSRKGLISLMQVTNSLTLIWRGGDVFSHTCRTHTCHELLHGVVEPCYHYVVVSDLCIERCFEYFISFSI